MHRTRLAAMSSVLTIGLFGACASPDSENAQPVTETSDTVVASTSAPGDVIRTDPAPMSDAYPSGTEASTVLYRSTGPDGSLVDTSGLLLVPGGDAPEGGWPVIAWGHGTTGIGDECAPSNEPGAYYDAVLAEFVANGYAVAATDYIGLGTPGTHPYLLADSAAGATIDMIAASRSADPDLSQEWVSIGHSQGGQASWAVAESMADAPDDGYRGAIALAPAPNLSTNVDDLISADTLVQQFTLMAFVGLGAQYDIDYSDYLGDRAQQALPATETLCFDDLTRDIDGRDLTEADFRFADDEARNQLVDWLIPHEIGHEPVASPLLVLQGTADEVVLPEYTRDMLATMPGGDAVEYIEYPGATHGSVLQQSAPDVARWLNENLPPAS